MLEVAKDVCERIVRLDPQILIAALIDEKGQSKDWYVKQGVPVPDDTRSEKMAQQTLIMMSIVRTAKDYLGEVEYIHTRMSKMDVIHFSAYGKGVMAVVLNRPYDEKAVTTKILDILR